MNKFNPASALAFIPPTLTDHMRAEKKRFSLKKTLIASIMILGAAAMFSVNASAEKHAPKSASMRPMQAEDFGPAASNEQGAMLLGQIEAKWSGVMRNIYGWSDGAFQQFHTGYRNSPVTILQNALAADTWEKMWQVFNDYAALKAQKNMAKAFPLGGTRPEDAFNPVVAEAKASAAKLLGEDARDLVFIPITPCTVWDTRFASDANSAGIIGNGITRKFYTHIDGAGGSFAPWGGNTTCPETAQNAIGGRPFAVMMTVYVNNPAGNGWLTFYRDGDADPSQATISVYYSTGPTRTQTVISKSSRGYGAGTYDIAVTSRFSSADASASVTGYFIKPQATALDCTTVVGPGTALPAGSDSYDAASCAAGYLATGGSCFNATTTGGLEIDSSIYGSGNGGGYRCYAKNVSAGTLTIQAKAQCCRVPGR